MTGKPDDHEVKKGRGERPSREDEEGSNLLDSFAADLYLYCKHYSLVYWIVDPRRVFDEFIRELKNQVVKVEKLVPEYQWIAFFLPFMEPKLNRYFNEKKNLTRKYQLEALSGKNQKVIYNSLGNISIHDRSNSMPILGIRDITNREHITVCDNVSIASSCFSPTYKLCDIKQIICHLPLLVIRYFQSTLQTLIATSLLQWQICRSPPLAKPSSFLKEMGGFTKHSMTCTQDFWGLRIYPR